MAKTAAKYPLFNFRASPKVYAALDALRREEADIPTRSEMARRIIERAADKKVKK